MPFDGRRSNICRHREQHHIHRVEPGPQHLARAGFAHCVAAAERHSTSADQANAKSNRTARGTGLDLSVLAVGLRAERHPAGTVLFARGDKGDAAFLVAKGEVEIAEFHKKLGAGQLFGEVALLSPDGVRIAAARCASDVELYRIDASAFGRAFYQDPAFAFALVQTRHWSPS